MSNLQQNTTTMQNLLNKINDLPSAGGVELPDEGGSGGLQACTLTIEPDGPCELYSGPLIFIKPDGTYENKTMIYGSIQVAQNSFIITGNNENMSGDTILVDRGTIRAVYYVTGDCSILANT